MPRSSASRDGDRRGRGRGSTSRGDNSDLSADYSSPATPFMEGSSDGIPDSITPGDEYATPSHGRGLNALDQTPINPSHHSMIYLHGDGYVYTF